VKEGKRKTGKVGVFMSLSVVLGGWVIGETFPSPGLRNVHSTYRASVFSGGRVMGI